MEKKGQKLTDRQGKVIKVVKLQRKRKTQKEECYSPLGSYTDDRVKIGPNTWNGLRQGIPYLKLPSGFVLLDKPRADFAPYYPSSELKGALLGIRWGPHYQALPSPIYQTLLNGRVDRTEEADQLELAGYSRG
ncbi:hypothetical protein AMECASPLE_038452 [Ameca splendens]|uniref:Uncharacterized protein n=1 Tax=Ameca splendens TaxID=208324 RepID=A0ABV0YVS1_9TELE